MKKLLLSAALLIVLPLSSAYAAGMDDLTMQVIETNDSKELMHNVEIPDSDKSSMSAAYAEPRGRTISNAADNNNFFILILLLVVNQF